MLNIHGFIGLIFVKDIGHITTEVLILEKIDPNVVSALPHLLLDTWILSSFLFEFNFSIR